MDEKRIEEILKDPNTWDWDGCTYSDLDVKEDWEDDFFEKLKEQVESLKNSKSRSNKISTPLHFLV